MSETISEFDICACGDYRRDHKNGEGPCAFNGGLKFDVVHGGIDCQRFRLSAKATEFPEPHRSLPKKTGGRDV